MTSDDAVTRVRKVLYERARMRRFFDHLNNIEVLMNLNPSNTIPSNDARVSAGSGPNWFYPSTGALDYAVLEAAKQCDKLADLLLDIARDLASVDFPAADKRHLRAALAAQAQAWRARSRVWRAPGMLNVKAATAAIMTPERTSIQELQHVAQYLKDVRPS